MLTIHCVTLVTFSGTENAADDDDRKEIAVEKATGGSYVVSLIANPGFGRSSKNPKVLYFE